MESLHVRPPRRSSQLCVLGRPSSCVRRGQCISGVPRVLKYGCEPTITENPFTNTYIRPLSSLFLVAVATVSAHCLFALVTLWTDTSDALVTRTPGVTGNSVNVELPKTTGHGYDYGHQESTAPITKDDAVGTFRIEGSVVHSINFFSWYRIHRYQRCR